MVGLSVVCRGWDAPHARTRDDERGGIVAGGILYILVMLLSSTALGGVGDPGSCSRCRDAISLYSTLFVLSCSQVSVTRASTIGRGFEVADCLRDRSGRGKGWKVASERSFFGIVSAKLGSVSSRISDNGRILAHDVAQMDCPRGSPKPQVIPPVSESLVFSFPVDDTNSRSRSRSTKD